MLQLSIRSKADVVLLDLVAPLSVMRDVLNCDYIIWMDTISKGRFEDTNSIFVPPEKYDLRIINKDAEYWSDIVIRYILERRNL